MVDRRAEGSAFLDRWLFREETGSFFRDPHCHCEPFFTFDPTPSNLERGERRPGRRDAAAFADLRARGHVARRDEARDERVELARVALRHHGSNEHTTVVTPSQW